MYSLLSPYGFITFISALPNPCCGRGIRNLKRSRQGKMAKAHYMPKILMWRGKNLASQRELLKGGVVGCSRGEEEAVQIKGEWQEGCLDGNAAAAAFSGA